MEAGSTGMMDESVNGYTSAAAPSNENRRQQKSREFRMRHVSMLALGQLLSPLANRYRIYDRHRFTVSIRGTVIQQRSRVSPFGIPAYGISSVCRFGRGTISVERLNVGHRLRWEKWFQSCRLREDSLLSRIVVFRLVWYTAILR